MVESNWAGTPTYRIWFDRAPLLMPSSLALILRNEGTFPQGAKVTKVTRTSVDQHYRFVTGKTREARDHFNELRLDLVGSRSASGSRTLQVTFRAYDDGIAFRYRVSSRNAADAIAIEDELTNFNFPSDCTCWALNLGKFGTGHEGEFRAMRASAISESDLLDLPLLCRTQAATFAIAQADLKDYAGMYLRRRSDKGLGVQAKLSPRLDDPGIAVQGQPGVDLLSSWRVVMIADHPGRLIESTLIANLNPSSVVEDTSWIKPGKYAWDWWCGDMVSGVAQPGMNDATMMRFIDFAAKLGLRYMLIDAGWYVTVDGHEGGPGADITRSIPEINLPALIEYGSRRNVGLFVWTHWKALDAQMDEALALYQKLGLKGVKVDFMDRDDQDMVGFYHRLLAKAAEHRLLVDLHGTYPPTGLSRTYPNLLTQEGVMGAEYNKWSARVTATHNVTLPFTRMLLGPMDYTPGGFRNVAPKDFVARYNMPFVQTTRGQALAMYVVYDSPFAAVADSPDAYRGQAGVDFLAAVPSSWDDTHVIAGDVGDFIVIARRSGDMWYVGAMTNEQERTVKVPLGFLGRGKFIATIYADDGSPSALAITRKVLDRAETLALRLAPSGGGVIALYPASSGYHA